MQLNKAMPGKIQNKILRRVKDKIFILKVPAYGNSIFYALGFLGLVCLSILLVSGLIMVLMGSSWWLTAPAGIFFRSIHLWSAQALVLIITLHVLVVFSTSGFKPPRRLTWVVGAVAFFLMLLEAEFGYYLRGDFSSQYRALQGADFWNGARLGYVINTLNHAEVFGIHVVLIPIIIFILLGLHYTLVKIRGIAKPYRKDVSYKIVPADHTKLFLRGGVLTVLIVILAALFPSPLISPASISGIARQDSALVGQTLIDEYQRASDTASYMDSIDPYQYDTREIYVLRPYESYIAESGIADQLKAFQKEDAETRQRQINDAEAFYKNSNAGTVDNSLAAGQPFLSVINTLVEAARSGLYQSTLDSMNPAAQPTYALRFMSDTGVLDSEADELHITTEQWGMVREENGKFPPGAWWLAPLGLLDHTALANDSNGDRDGAEILGSLMLLFVLFPYIPYLNRLPEKLHLAELIWKTGR